MVVSVVGYFFSIITVFTTVMTFMALLIGVFNHSTFEKVRHYPHPRPIIERATSPEPHHVLGALGTDEGTPVKDISARDLATKDSRAASIAKTDAENRRSERKNKPERLAHLHKPKVLVRQRQNYEGRGYAMALGYRHRPFRTDSVGYAPSGYP
jgi:hypothetical protein